VLQAVNALNMVELVSWADDLNIPIGIFIGRGLDHYNDFRILPPSVRTTLRQRFDQHFARRGTRDSTALRENVDSVFQEMDDTDFTEEQRRERIIGFMQFVNDMDKTRRLSFKTAFPDLYASILAHHGSWDTHTRYAR
jgi:hypothetical protein